MEYFPVALIAYNRISHTKNTIEALQKNTLAKDTELFIFCDGPQKPEHEKTVQEVRDYVDSLKDGFKKITVTKFPTNLHIDKATREAGHYMCERFEAFIGLEDDIETHPYFLEYMNKALHFYKDNKKVMCIMGYSHEPAFEKILKKYPYDVVFSYAFHSFGWGIWKHQWESIDWEMKDFPDYISDKKGKRKARLFSWGHLRAATKEYKYPEKYQLWDVKVSYNMARQDKFCVWPRYSYSRTIGFDGTGYHKFNFNEDFFVFPLEKAKKDPEFTNDINEDPLFHLKIEAMVSIKWVRAFVSNFRKFLFRK